MVCKKEEVNQIQALDCRQKQKKYILCLKTISSRRDLQCLFVFDGTDVWPIKWTKNGVVKDLTM